LKIADCRLNWSRQSRHIFKSEILNLKSALILVGCVTLARGLAAEGNSSLSDSKNESGTVTAAALLAQKEELRRQLSLSQETVQTLTTSLAESNAEAELFRRKFADLQLRMEALGLASASKDRAKLEQRLLTAVSDLQLAQKERDQYRDQMMQLSETMLRYLKTAEGGDPQARMDVETQLRSMNALVDKSAKAQPQNGSLLDGSVISVKEEWSFVVGNFGAREGVKIGMPLRVKRGDDVVAKLRVVDVRERICGAVIQESGKEKIKVGDRLEVDARPDVSSR
jgi:cell shape-determining protein MreC